MGNVSIPTIVFVYSFSGDHLALHQRNTRGAHCAHCETALLVDAGVRLHIKNAPGSGYVCQICTGEIMERWSTYAPEKPGHFMYNSFTATLAPFDGAISVYPIPASAILTAWRENGAAGVRQTAETLRAQLRTEFLAAHNIPQGLQQVMA